MPDVVSNTGPIIALAHIGQLDLLRQLFGGVRIPSAVRAEIKDELSLAALADASWIVIHDLQDSFAAQLLNEELDLGESETIILAGELNADLLLMDERAATRKARIIGLQSIGTLGVLLLAKQRGLISRIKPLLDALKEAGFYMSDVLYTEVLHSAGEAEGTP